MDSIGHTRTNDSAMSLSILHISIWLSQYCTWLLALIRRFLHITHTPKLSRRFFCYGSRYVQFHANLVFTCYLIEVMRCFISISKNVTNKHLSILQKLVIAFAAIITVATIIAIAAVSTPAIAVVNVIIAVVNAIGLIMVILIGAIMVSSFVYLFYLVFCYMRDSELGPRAMILLKDQLKNANIHFGIFMLSFSVAAGSMILTIMWSDQKWRFILLSIHYSSAGAGLFSMSLLVGYAVQVTQISIKSRKRLLT